MSNRNILILAGAALLLVIGIFYAINNNGKAKNRFNWTESGWGKTVYKGDFDQPYGTLVFKGLLQNYFSGKKVVEIKKSLTEELVIQEQNHSTYVFIGEGMYMDSLDTEHLKKYVKSGNTALIISKSIPFDLMSYIYLKECDEELGWDDYGQFNDTLSQMTLSQPQKGPFTLFYAKQNVRQSYTWSYIPSHVFCSELPQRPLGFLNDSYVNFADFPYGNGHFYLCTTPIAFSNFHLLRPEGKELCAGVLSHIKEGDFYWDNFSSVPEQVSRRRNNQEESGPRTLAKEHLLSFIIGQEALAWFWYLLLALTILYIFFRAQRRQRAIPVLQKNENASYEFINTISNLHFRERNHRGISIQAMKLWLVQIRERYSIVVTLDPDSALPKTDEEFFTKLQRLSQVPMEQIRLIFITYGDIARFSATEDEMINFHLDLERFWKIAK